MEQGLGSKNGRNGFVFQLKMVATTFNWIHQTWISGSTCWFLGIKNGNPPMSSYLWKPIFQKKVRREYIISYNWLNFLN